MRHLPGDLDAMVFAENEYHLDRLCKSDKTLVNGGVVRIPQTDTIFGRRFASLRIALEFVRDRKATLLINTHRSALVVAMAAKFVPDLGQRCHIYVRDFLWYDLEYIFARLRGAQLIFPSSVVADRPGYLAPEYLEPTGKVPFSIVPDMVALPSGEVSYEAPFLHLASVNEWKGHADLMMAIYLLKQRSCSITAESRGIADLIHIKTRLDRIVSSLGIGDCYSLGDYVSDPDNLLRSCRAVVIPSVSYGGGPETFGRTVIEAWAYRKPVVAYECGAVAHLIENEVDGLLVPEGDTRALADAMERLAKSADTCRKLGAAGYEKVLTNYEAGDVTLRLLSRLFQSNGERIDR